MATKGSITKTVRINADDLAVFEKIMADKMLSWSGVVHYLVETRGVPQRAEKIGKGVPQNSEKGCTPNDEAKLLKSKFTELSARVVPEAEKSFKNGQYDKLEIVPVGNKSENSIPGSLYDSIMSMVSTYGMTYEEFMKIIDEFLNKCFISYDGNEVYTVDSKLDTSGFIKKCDDNGIYNYQSAFDKIVKNTKFN